ncbi:MAG TPA: S9 family peptidase [Candidatus Polarisedimenticolia bacterium]|nr:S9 family peptidase [Candidatus Polarisedimenticolia bacterium]
MKRIRPVLPALVCLTLAAAPGRAAAQHPFSVHDMVAMERLGDPQPSPDGAWVVFTRRVWDKETNKVSTNLWLVSSDGRQLRRLTSAKASETGPRWSPDGRTIAFISNRGGSSQIWTIDPSGGEAVRKTDFPIDVDNVQWSPDGTRLAFTAEVHPECPDMACTARRDREAADNPVKARAYTRLLFRHWDTWEDGKRSHIFVMPGRGTAGPVDIMKGIDADSPTKPFGGTEEFSWSPSGREIAFTAKMVDHPAVSTDLDLYVASIDGGEPRCITEDNEAVDTAPAWSPDGRTIAYLSMKRPGYEADRQAVTLHDRATGRNRRLTESWDRSASSVAWASDGRTLFVTAGDTARHKIFSVDADSGRVTPIVEDHYNASLSVMQGGRLIFLRDSLTSPAEIFVSRQDGSDLRALTRVNAERMAAAQVSQPEEFWFTGARGDKVHGWLLKPVGFEPGRRHPLAFLIHGGPQGSWEDHFHYRWNPQVYAGAGYVTVAIDFHGSTGYGQAFTDAIRGDWGGAPYEDLMAGLDHVLATHDYVDGTRMGALGASYGGYMVNWIAGQTDRFRCLVSHDGEFDMMAGYYTTEELWFPEWEQGGTPWEKREVYERFSPSTYVHRWKTPMLVIHGALDYRLPETEGFAAFTALQRLGVPSKLLHFPDENHWVLKARNSILWHETVIGWLDQWLKK